MNEEEGDKSVGEVSNMECGDSGSGSVISLGKPDALSCRILVQGVGVWMYSIVHG